MPKICMITSSHSPFDDRILYKEATTLKNKGYEVVLVVPGNENGNFRNMAGQEVAPSDHERFIYDSEGIIIKGFKKKKRKSVGRYYAIIKNLIRLAIAEKAEIYHCHESDISLFAGIMAKRHWRKQGKQVKLIYDVHEYWPGEWADKFKNPLVKRLVEKLFCFWEKIALRYCDHVITANQITRGHVLLLDRFAKVEVLYNCPDLNIFPDSRAPIDDLLICHEGTLAFARGLKEMIAILCRLKERYPQVKLKIVGDVFNKEKEWLDNKIRECQLQNNIVITGWLPYDQVGKNIEGAAIGLIMFQPTSNNMLAGPPNRLFNYMRYGLAVVSTDIPETRAIIKECSCGVVVDFSNQEGLYRAISDLLEDKKTRAEYGEHSKKAVLEKYNWGYYGDRLLKVYNEMLNNDSK